MNYFIGRSIALCLYQAVVVIAPLSDNSLAKLFLFNVTRCSCYRPAGISWQDKITALRGKMTERKITWFVATALDEIACTI